RPIRPAWGRGDLLAVLLIVAGYALALLLLPPTREFAYLDDWTYARSVEKVVAGEGFAPSEYAQATLITPVAWGALFATLFGPGFTVLTLATMALSLLAALTFYALLRRLGFGTLPATMGVALLVLNPYSLVLSYSFMTEIPFVAMLLLACLCTLWGLQEDRPAALWLGSLFGALAFLTRQFGLVVPVAALLWLLAARRATWWRVVSVVLLPGLAVLGYVAWSRGFGQTYSGSVGREEILALLRPFTWVHRASHFIYLAAFLPGLTLPLYGRVRHWRVVAATAVAGSGAVYGLWQVKAGLVEQGQSTINDLSYTWLQPFWGDPVPIYCFGTALTVWLAGGLIERAGPGMVALLRRRRAPLPSDFLWLVALVLFAGTYLVSAGFLDRYWLPLLPFLIAAGLGPFARASPRRFVLVGLLLAPVAAYGVLIHLDDYSQHAARWAAGRWLVARGVLYDHIRNYAGWEGYYLGDVTMSRLGTHDIMELGDVPPTDQIIDPEYLVRTAPQPGYSVLAEFPYNSPLRGGQRQDLFVLHRQVGAPPR
ncbi:MAG TPA: glycosyltransferase family 39 protein, partial [Chloroflexia bacterium]|nr:glycosyltransferase family 39 protein [Chloroflexia bacterium]